MTLRTGNISDCVLGQQTKISDFVSVSPRHTDRRDLAWYQQQ